MIIDFQSFISFNSLRDRKHGAKYGQIFKENETQEYKKCGKIQ